MNLSLLKMLAGALLVVVVGCAFAWFIHHEREIGRAQVQAKLDAERAALQVQVREQQDRNRELQRQAELRYTVQGYVRDRFITQTITEIRHETDNLAACRLAPDAVRLLNAAGDCAREDRPASCGPDQQVRDPGPAS